MSWIKEVDDAGYEWTIHDEYGNIFKKAEGEYIVMVPRVIKLGPFGSLEEAKEAAKENEVDKVIRDYNNSLVKEKEE